MLCGRRIVQAVRSFRYQCDTHFYWFERGCGKYRKWSGLACQCACERKHCQCPYRAFHRFWPLLFAFRALLGEHTPAFFAAPVFPGSVAAPTLHSITRLPCLSR